MSPRARAAITWLVALMTRSADAQVFRSQRDVQRVAVGCVDVNYTTSTRAGLLSCYGDNRRATWVYAGFHNRCAVTMRCRLRWNGSPDGDPAEVTARLEPGAHEGDPTFGAMSHDACYDARQIPTPLFAVQCEEVVERCVGDFPAASRCACAEGAERVDVGDGADARQRCVTPEERERLREHAERARRDEEARRQSEAEARRREADARRAQQEREREREGEARAAEERRRQERERERQQQEVAAWQQRAGARERAGQQAIAQMASVGGAILRAEGVSGSAAEYRGPSWRVSLLAGVGFVRHPLVVRGSYAVGSTGDRDATTKTSSSMAPALVAGIEVWPRHTAYGGLAFFADGLAGWYGLSSGSDSILGARAGLRFFFGAPRFAVVGEGAVGYRAAATTEDYTSTSFGVYYSSQASGSAGYGYLRASAGLRLCFETRNDACSWGLDGAATADWRLPGRPDNARWGARLDVWQHNLGALRAEAGLWEVGLASETSIYLNISLLRTWDWFGAPSAESAREATAPGADAPAANPLTLQRCNAPFYGPDRFCAWRPAGTFECTPGAEVAVGCTGANASGVAGLQGLGVCAGDPVLRVCAGPAPCDSDRALASVDDTAGPCPGARVRCPASGRVTALEGDYADDRAGACAVEARDAAGAALRRVR